MPGTIHSEAILAERGAKPPFLQRRSRRLWLLPLLLCCCGAMPAADSTVSKEYQVKAAFIYNFTKFVEWPPRCFPESSTPIVIGILGRNPFGDELEKTIARREVNGRAIVIKIVASASEAESVNLLFVPAGEETRSEAIRLLAARNGMITVGESERFIAAGGMIAFVPEGDKVRFQINLETVDEAGLKISAQLLKLASRVRRKS